MRGIRDPRHNACPEPIIDAIEVRIVSRKPTVKRWPGNPILAANAITSETVRMESTATRIMSARAVYVHTIDAHHASRPVCR